MDLLQQITFNANAGPFYEKETAFDISKKDCLVRLIAFYLPQFHAIPENDLWWGKGFTEWTNVTKALPRFEGHYQPHLPGELGFYNLQDVDVIRRQAELAKNYGLHGFCFYYYWFGGKRLLEAPLNKFLAAPDINLPFCISWANENWSRRWDGLDQNVLMAQKHSPEDDIAFASAIVPVLRDARYIHVDSRPLLMLYKPGLLPNAAATIRRWRDFFQSVGVGNPYIVMPQGFNDDDPRKYGMDAAAGFPPHAAVGPSPNDNAGWGAPNVAKDQNLFDAQYNGLVGQYDHMMKRALGNQPTEFRLFPGVCPSWDNEARKSGKGACFIGSTPEKYGLWLEEACRNVISANRQDERIVFINAWNEWAEGAHLEPDRHFGYAYLAETARALERVASSPARPPDRQSGLNVTNLPVRVEQRWRLGSRFRRLARRSAFKVANAAEAIAKALRS